MDKKEKLKKNMDKYLKGQSILNDFYQKNIKPLKLEIREKCSIDLEKLHWFLDSEQITSSINRAGITLPCYNMDIETDHYPGSYLDKSVTTWVVRCKVCGLDREGYKSYGGYG